MGDGFEGCNDDEEDDATFDLLGGAKFVGVRGRSERIRKEERLTFFGNILTHYLQLKIFTVGDQKSNERTGHHLGKVLPGYTIGRIYKNRANR